MVLIDFRRIIIWLNLCVIGWCLIASPIGNPLYHFQELRLATFFSSFQLLASALLCFLVYDTARIKTTHPVVQEKPYQPHSAWILLALGLLFLSFDEVLMLHEQWDRLLHQIFHYTETAWSDRLDDLIILCYLFLGVFIFYTNRKTFKRYKKIVLSTFRVIFVLVILMIFLDILTNRADIIQSRPLFQLLSLAEELSKLAAEALILIAVYRCWKQTLEWQIGENKN